MQILVVDMEPMQAIRTSYEKSLRYFVLTKYQQAASTCVRTLDLLPGLQQDSSPEMVALRLTVWSLYLKIATTLRSQKPDIPTCCKALKIPSCKTNAAFCRTLWDQMVHRGHAGDPSQVDPRLVSAT